MKHETEAERLAYNAYYRNYRKQWSPEMKEKERQRKRDWIAAHPEQHRTNTRRAARKRRIIIQAHPEFQKAAQVQFNHSISLEEYECRLRDQGGICRLCNKPFTDDNPPVLDHNHDTAQLRDFIHRQCNAALGLFKDSVEVCKLAAEYLERHSRG
jgi:hypothetical protein